MKMSRILSYGEVLFMGNCLTLEVIKLLTVMFMSATSQRIVDMAETQPFSTGDMYIIFRVVCTYVATAVASVTAVEV